MWNVGLDFGAKRTTYKVDANTTSFLRHVPVGLLPGHCFSFYFDDEWLCAVESRGRFK